MHLFAINSLYAGGCWGNTEQIFDQLRRPVAEIEVLSTTHRSMQLLLYWRIPMVIEIASKCGTCACDCHKICIPLLYQFTILSQTTQYNIVTNDMISLFIRYRRLPS